MDKTTDEIDRLQGCINDLVSVLALPAVWSGGDPALVVRTLLDTITAILHLDFVYILLPGPYLGHRGELKTTLANSSPLEIRSCIDSWLSGVASFAPKGRVFLADGEISLAAVRLDLQGEAGWLVTGSRRSEFPEQTESMVLSVAANQAVIALQEASRLLEQQTVARKLDESVARRTQELAAANARLRREIAEREDVEARLRESELALRRALEEITGSEAKFRHVLDTIPVVAWCNLPEGPNEYLNKRWGEYTGLAPEDSTGWRWCDAMHPDDLPALMKRWGEILISGEPDQIEARLRGKDGVYRWFLIRAEPFFDETGAILRWYGTSTDIEGFKQAQMALQESEAKLGVIINTIPAMVWSMQPDGSADFFNDNYLAYTGMSAPDLLEWKWTRAVHPGDLGTLTEVWRRIRSTGQPGETEARLRRFDGEYRWFLMRAEPLRDKTGKVVKWYGLNTDIEGRKRAEERLLRSEEFLREGQGLARVGNFSWIIESGEMEWSEQLLRIFEFDSDDVITLEKIATRMHPEDLHTLFEIAAKARMGVSDLEYEHRLLMPDESVKYLRVIAHAVRSQEGRLEYIGAVQDVTQRHVSETALARARTELANVSRVTSLAVMTASIAHEVNQPISGVVTNASTCLRMLSADPPNLDGARETARRAIRDGNRASDVITRLRTLFARKAGAIEPLDLNETTREVIALSLSELQRNQVVLRPDLAYDLPPVRGDRVQLQQVIVNLVRNGAEAMTGLNDRPRELLIRTARDLDNFVRLSVSDVGIGLDKQVADMLFQPFFTTKADGMGIGLSISRSIIEAHGGRLWAVSNDGPGATFCFSVPCQSDTKVQ